MAAITEETGARLLAMLEAQQAKQQPPAPVQQAMPAPAPAFGMGGFGMPGMAPMMPAAAMQPAAAFGQPQIQPTGVSVTINYPLPDGSQLPINVHFGGEYLQNLPAFVQAVGGMFGQALKTWAPRQNGFGGGNGWNGGGNSYGRGRRW